MGEDAPVPTRMRRHLSLMNIRILRARCCGNAECVSLAPEVFLLDSSQKSVVIDAEAAPAETIIEAAEACPCGAIVVEDDDGNLLVG
jgi:ferredoxin